MKISLLVIGKTTPSYLDTGLAIYLKRLQHYAPTAVEVVADVKTGTGTTPQDLKTREGAALLKKIVPTDFVVLLDDKGTQFTSAAFARQLEKWSTGGGKRLVFVIGGAFGFGEALVTRSNALLSLSGMTFSHQMVRLIFLEQLYRAFTILKGEPYHHE